MLDLNKTEVRLKLHWASFHPLNGSIRSDLESYGEFIAVLTETGRIPVLVGDEIQF